MESISPNERLILVYEGEQISYVTPPEYYLLYNNPIRALARMAIRESNVDIEVDE